MKGFIADLQDFLEKVDLHASAFEDQGLEKENELLLILSADLTDIIEQLEALLE